MMAKMAESWKVKIPPPPKKKKEKEKKKILQAQKKIPSDNFPQKKYPAQTYFCPIPSVFFKTLFQISEIKKLSNVST